MEWSDVIVLGLVQGITEFLPISSSGHLILFESILGVNGVNGLAFDVILHFATIAAVITYFWQDVWNLMQVALRKLGRLPVNERDQTLLYALLIGTIPAAFFGMLLQSFMTEHLRKPVIVAIILLCASVFFVYTEWRYYLRPTQRELTIKSGLIIGLFQALALFPGMSRSGATIASGMLLGLSRYESTRFSFLLAIPIIIGAGAKGFIDLLREEGVVDWLKIGVGALVAYVMALIVIHYFLRFIRKYTLWPFVWYGVILSGMVLYVHFFT